MNNCFFYIRVTGVLIEEQRVLLVKQKVTENRGWSLPGGKTEHGETLEQALIREFLEETGINIRILKLLYVCDNPESAVPAIHITFLVEKTDGDIILPSNHYDENAISDVKFIETEKLCEHGFSQTFVDKIKDSFPDSGNYMGIKKNIGL